MKRSLAKLATQFVLAFIIQLLAIQQLFSQDTTVVKEKYYKNIVRYNLSSAILFGFDKYIVFGYERVIGPKQTMSINFGRASLPKFVDISNDSFAVERDRTNKGVNVSLDYRFYLGKENKYRPPHGVYIGPYVAYSHVDRTSDWRYNRSNSSNQQFLSTDTKFDFFTIGAEMGYQFILWKRLALDFVMIGPGMTSYKIKTDISSNISDENRKRLLNLVKEAIGQKYPGMDYILSDEQFDGNGTIGTWNLGYRYLIHIGFAF